MKIRPFIISIFITLIPSVLSCSKVNTDKGVVDIMTEDSEFILRAVMESDTKSRICDEYGALQWNALDSIAVFGLKDKSVKMVTEEGGSTAVFKAEESVTPTGTIYALYPYNRNASIAGENIYTVLPSIQNAVKGSYDPAAFISAGSTQISNQTSDINIGFYNICGGIRFTVTDATSNIIKVEFQGNNQEPIAGDISVSLDDPIPSAKATATSVSAVALENPAGFESTTDGETWYYISCLPCEFKKGFTLIFTCRDGSVFKTTCPSPVTMSRSRFISLRSADSQDAMNNIVTGEDLSVDGTRLANTYIINSAGFYKLPLIRMDNPNQYISEIDACSTIWETFNTDEVPAPNSLIDSLRVKGKYLYFHVGDQAVSKGGNALLAIHNNMGYIVWSWLICVCKGYDPESTAVTLENPSTKVMDRDLGALESGKPGMLFQWGRKDPFPGWYQSGKKMALNWAIELKENDFKSLTERFVQYPWMFGKGDDWLYTPDDTLWSDAEKKASDPCPYGWRVPSSEILESVDDSAFPKSGYMTKDGVLTGFDSVAKVWSSTPDAAKSKSFDISGTSASMESDFRSEGHSVRCVKSL